MARGKKNKLNTISSVQSAPATVYSKVSEDLKSASEKFDMLDKQFNKQLDDFLEKYADVIELLDKAREERNIARAEVEQKLREEIARRPKEQKSLRAGAFEVRRRVTEFYAPAKFIQLAKDQGIYEDAIEHKAIVIDTSVPFSDAKAFLTQRGINDSFEECEDSVEGTPAVYGPGDIPPFGREKKKRGKT